MSLLHLHSRIRDCSEAVDFLFWAWGQDVQQRKRETFLRYGFQRFRFHDAKRLGAKSMYCRADESGGFVCLWAFGILSGHPGAPAGFYKRGDLHLWILQSLPLPNFYISVEELKKARTGYAPIARLDRAVRPLLTFALEYETWIKRHFGKELREQCFRKWKKVGQHRRFEDFASLERCLLGMQSWANRESAQPFAESTIPLEC